MNDTIEYNGLFKRTWTLEAVSRKASRWQRNSHHFCFSGGWSFLNSDLQCLVEHCVEATIFVDEGLCYLMSKIPPVDWWCNDWYGNIEEAVEKLYPLTPHPSLPFFSYPLFFCYPCPTLPLSGEGPVRVTWWSKDKHDDHYNQSNQIGNLVGMQGEGIDFRVGVMG